MIKNVQLAVERKGATDKVEHAKIVKELFMDLNVHVPVIATTVMVVLGVIIQEYAKIARKAGTEVSASPIVQKTVLLGAIGNLVNAFLAGQGSTVMNVIQDVQ